MNKLYSTGEIAKLKGCSIDNINKLIVRYKNKFIGHIFIIGGRKLLDETGKKILVTMRDHRYRMEVEK